MTLQFRQRLLGVQGLAADAASQSTGRVRGFLARLAGLLGVGLRIRRDLAALSRLDDNMLRDIGISRWDVERIRAGDGGHRSGL